MSPPAELDDYLAVLRELPFVRGVEVTRQPTASKRQLAYQIELQTPTGKKRITIELKKSNLSRPVAELLVAARASKKDSFLLFAPTIGGELGQWLQAQRVAFLDRAGNCYIDLDGRYIARIQGNKPVTRAATEKGLRAPAYRALFALLAAPELVTATVRTFAQQAGVSRQAALDVKHRLGHLGILIRTRSGFKWVAGRDKDALDMFVTGYFTTLRPNLVLGRFRTRAKEPPAVEHSITSILGNAADFRWGGAAAAQRMTGHYRGSHTVIHLSQLPRDAPRQLQAIPDRAGALEVLMPPSALGLNGVVKDTAHPLLVYVELLGEGNERAREAAQEIAERWLPSERFA